MEKITTADVIRLRQDVQSLLRRRILEAIEIVLEEEVAEALGVGRHERGELRQGYRNGSVERRVTTANGTQSIKVPRARVAQKGGSAKEFRSELLPRYQRRTREVDEAILNTYLAGTNSRRIEQLRTNTGISALPVKEDDVGGFPTIAGGTACADADHDGMPDVWERARGLDPSDPSHGQADPDGDGYTNLEDYLNGAGKTNPPDAGINVDHGAGEDGSARRDMGTHADLSARADSAAASDGVHTDGKAGRDALASVDTGPYPATDGRAARLDASTKSNALDGGCGCQTTADPASLLPLLALLLAFALSHRNRARQASAGDRPPSPRL